MLRSVKTRVGIVVATGALALGAAGPASAAQNEAGNSLVNVQIGDVLVQVPVAVAANVCDVNANVLAEQNKAGQAKCDADATSTADQGADVGGSSNTAGDSLVNVQVGDITLQLPIALAANVCDVNVNVLAQQNKLGSPTCDAEAVSEAG